jgi:hypothetical protein
MQNHRGAKGNANREGRQEMRNKSSNRGNSVMTEKTAPVVGRKRTRRAADPVDAGDAPKPEKSPATTRRKKSFVL